MATRGMPEQARKLTELLEEKQEWNREVGALFHATRMKYQPTSQVQFANDLGISQGYLSQIENGVRTPSSTTLAKLQSIVEGGASANSTVTEQDEEKPDEA